MKKIRFAATVILVSLVAGCQSDLDRRYLDTTLGQRLELPPDLTEQEVKSSFELPEVFSGDDDSARDQIPVLAKVDSMRIEGDAGLYWLAVEEPVDNLYQLVKNFWASEGYRLQLDEPVIGVMQTEWILREQGTSKPKGNWFTRLFSSSDLSATQDQFKTRIQRGEGSRNRVYIAHRGTEYRYILQTRDDNPVLSDTQDDEDNLWRFRQPEPELEIEMLSRLMVYLGLQQTGVEQQLSNAKMFKPRAFMQFDAEENSPYMIVKDAYPIAWNRVYHNLERLNFDIDSAEFDRGFQNEGVIVINMETKEKVEEEGGFFSLFSSSRPKAKRLVLVLSEETHELTRVNIETAKGEFDTSAEGAEFLTLLYQQIK